MADFVVLSLSLPHAEEKPHFDRTSFRVAVPRGKIFATMPKDGKTANLVLSAQEQEILCAAEPELFWPVPNKWGEKGWTTVSLTKADPATLGSALRMAWKRAAPETLWSLLS